MARVGVIGAGAAGICAARHLAANSKVASFTVFERQASIGGTWVYTDKIGDPDEPSSMYKSLVTNLPDRCMQFPDFDFHTLPDKARCVPHTRVLKYLQDYAAHFDVEKYIKFRRRVEEVKFIEETGIWTVTTKVVGAEENVEVEEFDKIIFANGHYAVPSYGGLGSYESLSEAFNGTILHSHNYREPAQIEKGKKVVIIGAAASALDIAVELKNHGQDVTVSYRTRSKETAAQAVDKLGFNSVAEPTSIRGSVMETANGPVDADVIIFATGYEFDFGCLKTTPTIPYADQHIPDLYQHIFPARYAATLAFLGICSIVVPFPFFDTQTRFINSSWFTKSGQDRLKKFSQNPNPHVEYQWRKRPGWPAHYAHRMAAGLQWSYLDDITNLTDKKYLTPAVTAKRQLTKSLYEAAWQARFDDPLNYKSVQFKC